MSAMPGKLSERATHKRGLVPALRTKRTIALLRICVLAAVVAIYLSSDGIRGTAGLAAIFILVCAGVFAFTCLFITMRGEGSSPPARLMILALDVALITAWVPVTGGADSEFWTLYLIVIVAVALRYGIVETVGVAVALAVVHAAVLFGSDGLWSLRLYRPTLLIAAGFAVGLLSLQRTDQRHRRVEMEAIAESTARQLGRERAEVERLRRVDLERTESVSVAAHELRTPLAAILGVLSTLKEHGAAIDDRIRVELIEGAEVQAERLSRLVEDLLTVTRIEDGALSLSMAPTDPRNLIADAARAAGTQARVRARIETSGPVVCDADAIVRVLTNLLDNARKYSPVTTPIVVVARGDPRWVTFAVRDAGRGVAETDRDAIFERFRRAEQTGTPGAGLGLYISRGLVRAHGGDLEVGGSPEGGAEFRFWLPVLSPGDQRVTAASPDGSGAPLIDGPGRQERTADVNQVTVPTASSG